MPLSASSQYDVCASQVCDAIRRVDAAFGRHALQRFHAEPRPHVSVRLPGLLWRSPAASLACMGAAVPYASGEPASSMCTGGPLERAWPEVVPHMRPPSLPSCEAAFCSAAALCATAAACLKATCAEGRLCALAGPAPSDSAHASAPKPWHCAHTLSLPRAGGVGAGGQGARAGGACGGRQRRRLRLRRGRPGAGVGARGREHTVPHRAKGPPCVASLGSELLNQDIA